MSTPDTFTEAQVELLKEHARILIAAAKETDFWKLPAIERKEVREAVAELDKHCWHIPSCSKGERCMVGELNAAMREEIAVEVRFVRNVKLPGGGDADPEYVAKVDVDAGDILWVHDSGGEDAPDVAELLYTGQLPETERFIFKKARAISAEQKGALSR